MVSDFEGYTGMFSGYFRAFKIFADLRYCEETIGSSG